MNVGSHKGFVLVTGATGFLGHFVVAELLRRGLDCALLLRPPLEDSRARMERLLDALNINAVNEGHRGRWVALAGELASGRLPRAYPPISAVVHAAAVTAFQADAHGEPRRTNVLGTHALLEWATTSDVDEFHLVSSAYSCGRATGPVPEDLLAAEATFGEQCVVSGRHGDEMPPGRFHNAYEESKHDAERLCMDWKRAGTRTVTIHRPSVVVGEWASGRASRFAGFYISARATEFLDRSFPNRDDPARKRIPLRLRGRPEESQNIVPVDYVARMMAAIVVNRCFQGRVYHLTHPNPPTNGLIKEAFEQYFGIGGGRFVDPSGFDDADLNEHERTFYDISRPIEHYFVDTPTFLRSNTAAVEAAEHIACPAYDSAAIGRLIAFAQSVHWGRRRISRSPAPDCALYFESFLPEHVGQSRVAEMTALSVVMRFIIEDEPNGQWVCQFDAGRLQSVQRGANGIQEEFGYRTTKEVFWEAISGNVHPQALFLAGRAEVYGNVEKALKMAMILHSFTREFPCDQNVLANYGRRK